MDPRYLTIRRKLDHLGYKQQFDLGSLPLIEKLLNDLVQQNTQLKSIDPSPIPCKVIGFLAFEICIFFINIVWCSCLCLKVLYLNLFKACAHALTLPKPPYDFNDYRKLIKENNDLSRRIGKIKDDCDRDLKGKVF